MMKIPDSIGPIELPNVEWALADDIFIKQMLMDKANILVPQHSHAYDHISMLAAGSVRVWKDGKWWQDIKAPLPIFIAQGIKHTFMSLEPNTLIYCIHQARNGVVDIKEYA
jgi:quercetin dioxygenase-like cupin family protein